MRLTFFVTLAHILILFLFQLRKDNAVKLPSSKIIVHMKEEVNTLIKEPSKETSISKLAAKPEPMASFEDIELIEPMVFDSLPTIDPLQHETLAFREIKPPAPKESKPKSIIHQKPKESVSPKTKPTEKVKPKTAIKTAPKPKTNVTKHTSKNTETKKQPDSKLLSMMKDSLHKMDKLPGTIHGKGLAKTGSLRGNSGAPKIAKLKSESLEMTPVEFSYAEELAMYLKHHLHFPDEGSMKLKLVLSHQGKVEHFSIISSSSSKNKEIGEKTIASITFPGFGSRFPNEKSKNFTLQLNIE